MSPTAGKQPQSGDGAVQGTVLDAVEFCQAGDFAAIHAAERALSRAGFSIGRTQARSPRGLLFGEYDIQKWRNLNRADREGLHGILAGGRDGPVSNGPQSCPPIGVQC